MFFYDHKKRILEKSQFTNEQGFPKNFSTYAQEFLFYN